MTNWLMINELWITDDWMITERLMMITDEFWLTTNSDWLMIITDGD